MGKLRVVPIEGKITENRLSWFTHEYRRSKHALRRRSFKHYFHQGREDNHETWVVAIINILMPVYLKRGYCLKVMEI